MHSNYSSIKTNPSNQNIQIRHHLHLVFIYYSSFADRNNYHLLKHQNYRRFLIDSQIVKSTNQFPVFDILFKKISKGNSNAINFQEFLKLLPELATNLFSEDSRQSAFKKLIKNYIKKLQMQIRQNSEFGQDLSIIESFLDQRNSSKEQLELQQKFKQNCIFRKAYEVYISSTSMHQKCPADTFESFYRFLKDFQISPQLIYKSICYVAFKSLLKRKPQNTQNQFEIQSFTQLILILGEIITKKQFSGEDKHYQMKQRICRILQKMQVSIGFEKMSKLVKGQTYFSMSLVRMVIEQDGTLPIPESNNFSGSYSKKHRSCSIGNSVERGLNVSYESLNTLANQPSEFKQIKRIFQDLCGYGQVGNNKTLKSIKIKKLYIQTGLLKVISQVQLDLMITELIRKSSSGKIQFLHFVQLLNETARKLSVQQNQIYNLIINTIKDSSNNNFNINSSNIDYPQEQLNLLMQMLETISYPLQKIFHFYSKSKNQITFSEMTKLMYDFEIFPAILSKNKLYQIFIDCYEESLDKIAQNPIFKSPDLFLKDKFSSNKKGNSSSKYSSYLQNSNEKGVNPHKKQQKIMHITSFPLFLLKSSHEICQEGLNPAQKLIILLQKMHESKGQSKVVLGKGSLVSQLRKNYPQIYKLSFGFKQNKPQQQTVDDLLDDISEY